MSKKVMTKDFVNGIVEMHDLGLTFDLADYSDGIKKFFTLHGFIQKLRDELSGMGEAKGYTQEARRKVVLIMDEQLRQDLWNKPGATKEGMVGKQKFIRLCVDTMGHTPEEAEEYWEARNE